MLLEAPSLPQPALRRFLEQLASAGPGWCTLALLATRDAILRRPPSRPALLHMVLDACASQTSDTRGKAVRLVANTLFPDPGMAPIIEQAARRRLDSMVPPSAPPTTAAAEAAVTEAAGEQEAAAAAAEPLNGPAPGPAAAGDAAAAASTDGAAADGAGSAAVVKQETAQVASTPPKAQVQAPAAAAAGKEQEQASAATQGPSAAEAAKLCALYCALCTKKHSLLRHLFEVYAETSGEAAGPTQGGQLGLQPAPVMLPASVTRNT